MRRRFVSTGLASILVLLVTFGCSAKVGTDKHSFVVPLADLVEDGPVTTIDLAERGVQTDLTDGIHLVRLHDGSFRALSWRDTHRTDCRAMYRPDLKTRAWVLLEGVEPAFHTECTGSVYDLAGHPLAGPAPRGLDQFAVQVRGEDLVVYLEDR